MHYFFNVTALFTICYFALLNGLYVLFTLISWRSLSLGLKHRELQGFEEPFDTPNFPGITVIVPAYNEEAGIVESVRSLVDLRYPKFEIIVVSDGSSDATVERLTNAYDLVPAHRAAREMLETKPIVSSFVSRRHPNLWVIEKENGGKADALNVGIDVARYPYFCAIDADALIEPDALLQVAAPILSDPARVVASGGIVRIVNGCTVDQGRVVEIDLPKSRLAVFQVIEYFRAFLVGRVGWTRFNSLLIISGAFGLFHRDLVANLGGYATDTVGEDLELVVRIHRYHRERNIDYRVVFVPDPVCWTEAPEDLATLSRQRRRWHRGLGQTLWRHRAAMLRPSLGALGLLALPYFLFFEFLGPVIEIAGPPITIIAFILGYLSVPFLVAFIVIAFLLGVALTIAALTIEEFNFRRHQRPRDIVRMLFYSVAENIGYRQLTDFWRAMAFIDLAKGKTEWGAQKRRGFQSSVS